MLEYLKPFLTSYSLLTGIVLSFFGIVTSFFGNKIFKYFLFFTGLLSGFFFGGMAGVNFSQNYVLIIIASFTGACVFSVTFFLYRTIAIFFIGCLFPFAFLAIFLKIHPSVSVSISLIAGILTVVFRRFMLSAWLSLAGAVLLFLGFTLLAKHSLDIKISASAALAASLAGFFFQIRRRKRKREKKEESEDPPPSG